MSAHWQKKIICIWLYKNDPPVPHVVLNTSVLDVGFQKALSF